MITVFPDPYPDELLYSVCARYQERMMWGNQKMTLEDLFGSNTVVAVVDLPGHVDALISHLPAGHRYSSDEIIDRHTLLPYFSPFLAASQLEGVRLAMRRGSGSGISGRAGIMASTVKTPQVLQYCPQCVEADRTAYGEAYWHRVHQLPGLTVCPHHPGASIYPSQVAIHSSGRRQGFDTLEATTREAYKEPALYPGANAQPDLNTFVAHQSWGLLSQSRVAVGLDALRQRYMEQLQNRDLANTNGRIRAREFVQQFEQFYGRDWLRAMGCGLTEDGEQAWVLRMVRHPKGSQHPFKHLLLAHFLGMTMDTLLEPKRPSLQVNRLWPCLNRVAVHYGQPLISEAQSQLRQTREGKVGVFTCSCGFSYRCAIGGDPYLDAKVVQFGPIWEAKLKKLSEDAMVPLRGAARILGVDPATVKYRASRLQLGRWQRPRCPGKIPQQGSMEGYHQHWLDVQAQYPAMGRTALRQMAPAVWAWLYRYDREWLMDHQPPAAPTLRPERISRVDWAQRDRDCADQVPAIVTRLKQQQDSVVRVTAKAIFRELGYSSWFERHSDKLPLTVQAISAVVEDRMAFALRRLDMAAVDFWHTGQPPKTWELLRVAGIRTDLAHLPAIQDKAARLCDPEVGTTYADS